MKEFKNKKIIFTGVEFETKMATKTFRKQGSRHKR